MHRIVTALLLLAPTLLAADAPRADGDAGIGQRDLPNVIVVLADDLGIGDVQPTNPNGKIPTPRLNELARGGMTFLDAHSTSAVCTPTRYSLLTGRYNWRSRLARGVLDGYSGPLIPADRPTLGHLMRRAGYTTAMMGKWHLGWDWSGEGKDVDFTGPVTNGPDVNGFDRYFAHAASLDMPPYVWVDTGRITAPPDREEGVTRKDDRYGWYREGPVGADFQIVDVLPRLFREATSYVAEKAPASKEGEPFFLYLALPAPHTPIVPIEEFVGKSELNPYADFVMQVDHHMGELLDALEAAGVADDTIVMFTSDNGCSPEANFELLGEAGHRPSKEFRGHKADLYEGGHRVPLVVRWPGRVPAGRTTRALACLTDIYSTLEEVVGQERRPVGGEDGFSWVPLFEGEETSGRKTLISHSVSGHFAYRVGDHKLLLASGSGGWSAPREKAAKEKGLPPMQLYLLGSDPGETSSAAGKMPKVVRQMLRDLSEEVRRGRCTPGEDVPNDREIEFLPEGVTIADD